MFHTHTSSLWADPKRFTVMIPCYFMRVHLRKGLQIICSALPSLCFFNAIFSAVRQSSIKWLLLYLYTTVGAYALLIYEQGPVSTPEKPLWINISRLWYTQFISALQCMTLRFGSNVLCRNHFFLLTESLKSNLLILKKWKFPCTDFWDSIGILPAFVSEGGKSFWSGNLHN